MSFDAVRNTFLETVVRSQRWTPVVDRVCNALSFEPDARVKQVLHRPDFQTRSPLKAVVLDGRCVIAYSTGSRVGVYSEELDQAAECEFDLGGEVCCASLAVVDADVHLFVADATGALLLFHVEVQRAVGQRAVMSLSLTLQRAGERQGAVRRILPIAFHPRLLGARSLPQYFWAVCDSAVLLYEVSLEGACRPSLSLALPAECTHWVSAEVIEDSRDANQGLIVNYFDKTKEELLTVVVDTAQAIVCAEQRRSEGKMDTLKQTGLRALRSPVPAPLILRGGSWFSAPVETQESQSVVAATVVRTQRDRHVVLDGRRVLFDEERWSWTLCLLCRGDESGDAIVHKIQYTTKQQLLREELSAVGERLLVESSQIDSTHIDFHDRHSVATFTARNAAKEPRELIENGSKSCLLLWKVCAKKKIVLSFRNEQTQSLYENHEKADEFAKRCILLEAMLALDLTECVTSAIESRRAASVSVLSEDFVLMDVQRFFERLVGGPQSVLDDVHIASRLLLQEGIVPELRSRNLSNRRRQASFSLVNAQREICTAARSLRDITEALLRRKQSIVSFSVALRRDIVHTELGDDLVSQSLVELFLLRQSVQVLCRGTTLSLALLLEPRATLELFSGDDKGRIASNIPLRRELCESMKGVLPDYLCTEQLLLDVLMERSPRIDEKTALDFSQLTLQKANENLAALLNWPADVAFAHSHGVTASKAFKGRTLDDISAELDVKVVAAARVVQYVLLDASHASLLLLQGEQQNNDPFKNPLCDLLRQCFDCEAESVELVHALQLVDCGSQLTKAVQKLSYSTGMAFLDEENLLLPVLRRLLSSGRQQSAWEFLRALAMRDHAVLSTMEGAVAIAVAQPDSVRETPRNEWRKPWVAAKRAVSRISSAPQAYQALMDITNYMTIWALRYGELADFLQSDFDLLEVEAIICSLENVLGFVENDASLFSATVNTLFAFLLKHFYIDQARKIHERHCNAVGDSMLEDNNTIACSIGDREALLAAFGAIDFPQEIDHRLALNLSTITSRIK